MQFIKTQRAMRLHGFKLLHEMAWFFGPESLQ